MWQLHLVVFWIKILIFTYPSTLFIITFPHSISNFHACLGEIVPKEFAFLHQKREKNLLIKLKICHSRLVALCYVDCLGETRLFFISLNLAGISQKHLHEGTKCVCKKKSIKSAHENFSKRILLPIKRKSEIKKIEWIKQTQNKFCSLVKQFCKKNSDVILINFQ